MPHQALASDSGVHTPSADLDGMKVPGRTGVAGEFTWDDILQIVGAGRLELLGRTVDAEAAYAEDMRRIREEHGSVVAYIRSVKLADFVTDAAAEYLMVPNDYPYALPANTTHYIVWSKAKLAPGTVPDPAVLDVFAARLDTQIGAGGYEWVWFVNPPHLQSIPEFVHGHLIVRKL